MTTLPDAAKLIVKLRAMDPAKRNAYLDSLGPVIDQPVTTDVLAAWLDLSASSIRTEQFRLRANGSHWPEPTRFGRSLQWSPRAVILHRASQPGPGNRTPRST